jgi:hypothetical protein
MKKIAYFTFATLITVGLAAFFPALAQTPTCDITPGTRILGYVGGAGSTQTYLAQMDGVENDLGIVALRLKGKGANFYGTTNYPVTSNYRMTAAAADLNLDGLDDLIQGGRDCDRYNFVAGDTNLSIHISEGVDPADPNRFKFKAPVYIDYLATINFGPYRGTYEMVAIGAGDLDRDGDPDIIALDWRGICWVFWNRFKENNQTPGDMPVIDNVPTPILGTVAASDLVNDGYGEYGTNSSYWRWESTIVTADLENDGDLDVFVAVPTYRANNRYGQVVILVNNGSGVFSVLNSAPSQHIEPYGTQLYGTDGIATGDYDGDNKLDFVVCSVSDKTGTRPDNRIWIYDGDGLGNFTKKATPILFQYTNSYGYPNMLLGADLDSDGDRDFVIATDGYLTSPTFRGGYVYWYRNDGGGVFTKICIPASCARVSSSGDTDSGAVGDFDGDDDPDFFVADGNDSRSCYFFMNKTFPIYVPTGSVWSKNRMSCDFIDSDNAIVSATAYITDTRPSGTTITYYLSNSNDEAGVPKWEGPVTNGVEWNFQAPGNFLRWKAVLTSSNELVTPKVTRIELDYKYLTKREYSRTSQALALVDIGGSEALEEVLYSASFAYPKWQGHLRSWDVTHLNLAYTRNSEIQDIKSVNAVYLRDAGVELNSKAWSSRTIYTAHEAEGDGKYNDRIPFNLAYNETLDNYLGLGETSPEIDPLIKFVLGYDRAWKLGDINHSSPQSLYPPHENPVLMGAGYEAWMNGLADRPKVILVGANDGMLHCFDPVTLEELWGFIPNNLLPKLKRMRLLDPDCGEYINHEFFVDGTPAIGDVYFDGAWRTVLVCGQGAGWGRNNLCYYFALDITDPTEPQPLWEFSDPATIGQTWSTPAIGRLPGSGKWVAFFGSGYDNNTTEVVGNRFYAVDIETGLALATLELSEPSESSPFGIQNTLPGAPAAVDLNNDGYVDIVLIGDLHGRMWRINVAEDPSRWDPEVIYRDPYGHPIITKPAVDVSPSDSSVKLYFGTGGDEAAPNNGYYSFLALKTSATGTAAVDWYLGLDDLATQLGISPTLKKGEMGQGEKVWADPVVADHVVYIATLFYSIENLNPCLTLTGSGKIYARYTMGTQVGGSALLGTDGEVTQSLFTKQKVRSAVAMGEVQRVEQGGQPGIDKRKVFIQDYTAPSGEGPEPPSEVLAMAVKHQSLIIKSWREVYKIIR